mmetsp:Transcript_32201/g.55640  ORF Transcript_32201/g.55640 Transcript_32201/m.55640 type:complete len:129 (-) Transcript_32201:1096-1482(-)
MEDYLKAVSSELQSESDILAKLLEPGYKQLAVKTFDCMSACFKLPGSADDCGACADRCNTKLSSFQAEMDERMQSIQVGFQTCVQACAVKKDDNDVLKQCVTNCSDETKQLFSRTKSQVNDIINKFLV